jgi:AAA domain
VKGGDPGDIADEELDTETFQPGPKADGAGPPPPESDDDDGQSSAHNKGNRKYRFPLVSFDEIKFDGRSHYLVKGLLPETGMVVIWGKPKSGKSFWATDLLMHVALGLEYRGLSVRQGAVVYCTLEGVSGFQRRIEGIRKSLLKAGDKPDFHMMANALTLGADYEVLIRDIKDQLGQKGPAVIAVDTLNRSLGGSESSDEDMGAYIKAADALRDAFDCLVVIVHHAGHEGQRPRGHSSLLGALDVLISVKRSEDQLVVAEVEMAKDDESGETFVSKLEQIWIGDDQDGEKLTTCAISAVEGDEARKAKASTKGGDKTPEGAQLRRAFADVYEMIVDSVEHASGFDGKPVKKVSTDTLRDAMRSRGWLESDGAALTTNARKKWSRLKVNMLASGEWVEKDGHIWRVRA